MGGEEGGSSPIHRPLTAPSRLQALLQFEAEIGSMLDGQPEGASDAELCEAVHEAEDYELEFVLPAVPATEAEAAAAAAGEGKSDVWGR